MTDLKQNRKILIVEDEVIIAKELELIGTKLGCKVCGVVQSGEDAILYAKKFNPDLILMDIVLQGKTDGIEAANTIKKELNIPVMYITAYDDEAMLNRVKENAPLGYLLKPFEQRDVRAALTVAFYRIEADRKIRESEERFFRFANNARDLIYRMNIDNGSYEYVNNSSTAITGYTPEEFYVTPMLINKIIHPDWKRYFEFEYERMKNGEVPPIYEYQIIHKDGEPRWLNQRNVLIRNSAGKPVFLEGIVTDVTDRKRSDMLLRLQKEEYKNIFDSFPAMVFVKDHNNRILRVNELAARTMGRRVGDIEGKYFEELYPQYAKQLKELEQDVIVTGTPKKNVINLYDSKLGGKIWLKMDIYPYRIGSGDINGVILFAQDITEQKQTEAELQKIEFRNSILINSIPDLLYQVNKDFKIVDYKVKDEKLMISPTEEFLNYRVSDVFPENVRDIIKKEIEEVFTTREVRIFEYQQTTDKHTKDFEARLVRISEEEVLIIIRDITDKKTVEKALLESELKYRNLAQNAPVALTRINVKTGKYEYVNDQFVKSSGYTMDEFNALTNEQLNKIIYKDDSKWVFDTYNNWMKNGFKGTLHMTYRCVNKGNRVIWLDSYHYADYDAAGKVSAINQVYVDITEAKEAETQLKESELKFRTLTETIRSSIAITTGEKFLYVNPYTSLATGYTEKELLNMNFWELIHPDYREMVKERGLARLKGSTEPELYEVKFVKKDGESRWIQISAVQTEYEGQPAILSIVFDIDEHKKSEEALRQSEEKFRAVAESMPAEIVIYQGEKFVYANPYSETITGYTVDELLKMNFWQLVSPEFQELAKERGYARQRGEKVQSRYRISIITKSGEEKWLDLSAVPIQYNGRTAVLGTAVDITEQEKFQRELERSEKQYRAFIEQSTEGIYRTELFSPIGINEPIDKQVKALTEGCFIAEANLAMAKMYGFEKVEDITGKKVSEMLVPEDPENIEYTKRFIGNNYRIENEESHELHAQGKPVYFSNNAMGIIKDGFLYGVWGTQTDITKRKIAEEKLLKSLQEKEVLLKEIHHRVKNNLQIVNSLLKLQSSYIKDKKTLEILKESQNRVASMALIHQKLYYSKDLSSIDFGEYIKMLISHLTQSFGGVVRGIEVKVNATKIDMVIDDAVPCGLIINELVTNSFKHAFPGEKKGEISITVNKHKDEFTLQISDNGIGLPQDIKLQSSDSFGLKLVNTLVSQMKGSIEVCKAEGTLFIIKFKAGINKPREEM
jgi:PAS domain S-box-containing protein